MLLTGSLLVTVHGDAHLFDRALADGADGIDVVDQAVIDFQHLGIGNLDAPLIAGGDGEDIGLDDIVPDVFQQGGVAVLAYDLVIDAAGFLGPQDLGVDGLAIDPHRQLIDSSTVRQRER